MAYRSHTASPAGSQSPSSSSSTNASPYINTTPLDNMVSTDDNDSSYSAHGTPNHSTTNLPRTLNASKGGCWTCRVRRKKCDEQREGDSCKTCKRLMIKCLGWGPKRPDWMRDKKMVDAYKASIKAQLSRAGLIRGQPRHNPLQIHTQRGMQQIRPPTLTHTTSTHSTRSTIDSLRHTLEPPFIQTNLLVSGMPTPTTPFDSYNPSLENFDPSSNLFWPQQPVLFNPAMGDGFDEFLIPPSNEPLLPDPSMVVPNQGQNAHEERVMHYFNNVQEIQPFFAGESLRDLTYAAILKEPRGAVTLAICALADYHFKQTRIDKGLEAPNPSLENSSTTYYRNEAMFQLGHNKNTHGSYTDNDALAALHLISLSQLSGGISDWDAPFDVLCQWLLQTNLPVSENPWIAFHSLAPASQLYAKAILWLDIFSSLSVLRPPKFLLLWQSLLGEFWNGSELERQRMDILTGCPDEAMLAIAEVSALASWKAAQLRNNCLSYPDLIRRGTNIEQQLRGSQNYSITADPTQARVSGPASAQLPEEQRPLVANIFREAAHLYLHTVLSNSTPGVPEITTSVQTLVGLFSQLPPGEQDRILMFPICLAGSMTNDSTVRSFFKERIRALNENYGNLLQTRRLMEEVWQKRDAQGREVDLRETIREQGLKLLLI